MAWGVHPSTREEPVIGALLRVLLVLVVVVAAVAFFVGYRSAAPPEAPSEDRAIVGMTGRMEDGLERANDAAGRVLHDVREAAIDGTLATKIRSKMALDDLVKARHIKVRATHGVVTLEGTVRSDAERTRAVELARETAGVHEVHDKLEVLEHVQAADPR
jgi:hypothetical protein